MKKVCLSVGNKFQTLDGYEIIKSISEYGIVYTESHQVGSYDEDTDTMDFEADIVTGEGVFTKSDIDREMKALDGLNHKIELLRG